MANKSDEELGMAQQITRRDLIHDAGLLAAGLMFPLASHATTALTPKPGDYPPVRTGMRGSHPGAFEGAHALARDGKIFSNPTDLNEQYDLIVVGGGISGLAAAYYYRQRFGANAKILLLENHDDFGGHAKRNEFHQGGQMRLALGGTHNLEYWQFNDTVNTLMADLGIDTAELRRNSDFEYGSEGKNGAAIWFDEQTYGENKLLTDASLMRWGTPLTAAVINQFPMSAEARSQLTRLYTSRENLLNDLSEAQLGQYLSSTSYTDFLRTEIGLGDEALQLFDNANHGAWGVETRALSVAECLEMGMPGLTLLGREPEDTEWDYPAAFFPDGNASVARLLVQKLIPDVAPGANSSNIALAKFNYSQLDKPKSAVRLRLNSTATGVKPTAKGVAVSYLKDGNLLRVNARHCVMACYHSIIPHLCPDLPDEQKAAQKYQVKTPLLLTNVLLRSSAPLDKLGIAGARCPGRMHGSMFMFRGINNGGYEHRLDDNGAVPLTFWGSISPPADVIDVRDQLRASGLKMLSLTFEDYEREVRTVLDGLLGPVGFDVNKDILAITVNRWPHGYAYEYLDLWDPEWAPGKAPHEIASEPFGNITIANADAGASAYTHTAIDEAFRAVSQLP
ncbi:MAG: FAD-dependent oxidoreductase [Halioglobus sp.]